ncbi:DUF4174 domain-containing protein [Roseibium sp. HPY-6]|uniref:DUF4174 domain-containing protein n=1 Tax=Roseibium sp. HPY-6 TaxID=3229852 RepID=UPI00338DD6E2
MATKAAMFFAMVVSMYASSVGTAIAGPSDSWAWKYRVLLVFATHDEDPSLLSQRQQLMGMRPELDDRHMSVIEIIGDKARSVSGADLGLSGSELKAFVRKNDARFEVLLLGKDTGIKLRSPAPLAATDIFSLIDTMPMRQHEMKRAGR